MSSHFVPICKPVFRDMRHAKTVQDEVQTLAIMEIGHVGTRTRHATGLFGTAPTYGRLLALLLQCSLLYVCCRSPNRHAPTYFFGVQVKNCSTFLHAHRKKTKHSQGGGKMFPCSIASGRRHSHTVTAPSLPDSVQDVTSILYNFCLVMRRVHRNRSRSW
jgi:hypothetical protein